MTLTTDQLKEHVETDLGDDALQRLLDDAYATVANRVGEASGEVTEHYRVFSSDEIIFLNQAIASEDDITSITVRVLAPEAPMEDLELETEEWRWMGGRMIQRLEGTDVDLPTPTWWGFRSVGWPSVELDVVIAYTPASAAEDTPTASRTDRVVIDLCKLAIQYSGLASERAGDYAYTSKEYQAERESLLKELAPKVGFA